MSRARPESRRLRPVLHSSGADAVACWLCLQSPFVHSSAPSSFPPVQPLALMSSMYTSTTATYGEGRRSVNRPASAAAASSSSYASHTAASTARAGQSTAASAAPSSSSSPSSSADVSSKAAFKASLSRVQKLFGLAQATQGQQYASSRLAYIPIELLRCTAEERPAANLLQPGRKSYWSTASGQNHELVFKMSVANEDTTSDQLAGAARRVGAHACRLCPVAAPLRASLGL